MHIAAAFRRPVLSVWGNTVPAFGMYPYYGNNYLSDYRPSRVTGLSGDLPYEMMEVKGLGCRPAPRSGLQNVPGDISSVWNCNPRSGSYAR